MKGDKNSFYNTIKYKVEIPSMLNSARLKLEKVRKCIKELEDIINNLK